MSRIVKGDRSPAAESDPVAAPASESGAASDLESASGAASESAARSGRGRVIRGSVFDAQTEASDIVADARAQAEDIRAQARADGREQGLADVAAALVAAEVRAGERVAAAEAELTTLAVRIAERILRRQLDLEPERVADIARSALEEARGRGDLVMRVHPDDVSALERERPSLLARLSASAQLLIRADDSVARGGCVIDSDLGTVDARLDVQLAAIERALGQQTGEREP